MTVPAVTLPTLRTPLRRAVLDTRGCALLITKVPDLERTASDLTRSADPHTRAAASDLLIFLAEVRAAARDWRDYRTGGSGTGTAEPALPVVDAVSPAPPWDRLTVDQVAGRFGWSSGYVRRLCRAGVLSATHRGRAWSIDAESVDDFEARRQI
jgi:excisionase family DNA binding protein